VDFDGRGDYIANVLQVFRAEYYGVVEVLWSLVCMSVARPSVQGLNSCKTYSDEEGI
jgi:hypothetical protein